MKGTYIKVLNDVVFDELKALKAVNAKQLIEVVLVVIEEDVKRGAAGFRAAPLFWVE